MKIINKYKIVLVLMIIAISMVGCTKKEKGKQVLAKDEKTTQTASKNNTKDALDIIDGKCVVIEDTNTLYPMIVVFGKDSYIEYIQDTSSGSHKVLDVKSEGNIVTYSVEFNNYDEVQYYDINLEVLDGNSIKYIYDDGESKTYKLISKAEAAVKMKDYEEKVENGLTIENKNSEYIIHDSDVRRLTEVELSGYSKAQLAYIRNEIFARYGYVFNNEEYKKYFSKQSWYTPDPSFDGNIESISQVERDNVNLLKKLEGK